MIGTSFISKDFNDILNVILNFTNYNSEFRILHSEFKVILHSEFKVIQHP